MRLRPVRCFTLAISIGVLALSACGSDDSVGPPPPHTQGPPVWSEITDLVPSPTVYGMWAESEKLITAVGRGGQIWQWNGVQWTQVLNADGHDLFAIDGSVNGSALAVGDRGTMLKRISGSFVTRDAGVTADLHDVWTSPSGDFFVVGDDGLILRASATSVSNETTPVRTALFSVWGANDTDIFATGVDGVITHYDGGAWSNMTSPTTELLAAVDGTSATDVYAAGGSGTIIHYDGNSWATVESHTTNLLQACCASCGPAVAGANGSVAHLENGIFQNETLSGSPWLYAMAHTGTDTWVAGSHTILRHGGLAWSPETRGTIPGLRAMTTSPSGGLVVAGDGGNVMLGGPSQWESEDAGAVRRLNSVWTSPDGEIFAAGTSRIYRRTNSGWVTENSEIVEYFDIGGNADVAFAVGKNYTVRERKNAAWSIVYTAAMFDLHRIYMTDREGFIVGSGGAILEYDTLHNSWHVRTQGTFPDLWDIIPAPSSQYTWIVVGVNGFCRGRSTVEGVDWTPIPTGVTTTLYSLVAGTDNDLYAVGANGTVLHFVDDAWTSIAAPTTRTFFKGWMQDGALFVCGGDDVSGGFLFRYGPPAQ